LRVPLRVVQRHTSPAAVKRLGARLTGVEQTGAELMGAEGDGGELHHICFNWAGCERIGRSSDDWHTSL
jgi:hypothetical protein